MDLIAMLHGLAQNYQSAANLREWFVSRLNPMFPNIDGNANPIEISWNLNNGSSRTDLILSHTLGERQEDGVPDADSRVLLILVPTEDLATTFESLEASLKGFRSQMVNKGPEDPSYPFHAIKLAHVIILRSGITTLKTFCLQDQRYIN